MRKRRRDECGRETSTGPLSPIANFPYSISPGSGGALLSGKLQEWKCERVMNLSQTRGKRNQISF